MVHDRRPAGSTVGLAVNALLLLAAALWLRVWNLGNIPGINGDEAWSGVQAMRLVHGEPIAWWTPTGNPVNVFFLVPLAALHAVFSPSFALLRTVSVVSGVAALGANYGLCRRAFDRPTAIISTLLLALLPIDIAYSRFAWDASQSLLAVVLVLYLPLILLRGPGRSSGWLVATLVALGAAVWVHPTNVFAAPLVVVPAAYARRRQLVRWLRRMNVPARPGTFALLVVVAAVLAYFAWNLLTRAASRLHGPGDVGPFIANYWELLSGVTVYSYIAGLDEATGRLAWLPVVCNVMLGGIVAVAGWGWLRRLDDGVDAVDASLLMGWIVMLGGYFLVAGPEAIAPHFERYGICLVAPAVLVAARTRLVRGRAADLRDGGGVGAGNWRLAVAADVLRRLLRLHRADWRTVAPGVSHGRRGAEVGGLSTAAGKTARRRAAARRNERVVDLLAAGLPGDGRRRGASLARFAVRGGTPCAAEREQDGRRELARRVRGPTGRPAVGRPGSRQVKTMGDTSCAILPGGR